MLSCKTSMWVRKPMLREQEPVNQYKSMFALIVKGLEVLKSCLTLHLDI